MNTAGIIGLSMPVNTISYAASMPHLPSKTGGKDKSGSTLRRPYSFQEEEEQFNRLHITVMQSAKGQQGKWGNSTGQIHSCFNK